MMSSDFAELFTLSLSFKGTWSSEQDLRIEVVYRVIWHNAQTRH
jgi:hypothetical protein